MPDVLGPRAIPLVRLQIAATRCRRPARYRMSNHPLIVIVVVVWIVVIGIASVILDGREQFVTRREDLGVFRLCFTFALRLFFASSHVVDFINLAGEISEVSGLVLLLLVACHSLGPSVIVVFGGCVAVRRFRFALLVVRARSIDRIIIGRCQVSEVLLARMRSGVFVI